MIDINLYALFVNMVFGSIIWATFGIAILFGIMCLLFRMSPMLITGIVGLFLAVWGMMIVPGLAFLPFLLALWYFGKGVYSLIRRYYE